MLPPELEHVRKSRLGVLLARLAAKLSENDASAAPPAIESPKMNHCYDPCAPWSEITQVIGCRGPRNKKCSVRYCRRRVAGLVNEVIWRVIRDFV